MDETQAVSVSYVAVVERVPGKEFRIRFPDFAEVRSAAESMQGASDHAAQALRARIEDLLRNGKRVPRPTSVDAVKEDPENRHGFLLRIEVEVPRRSLCSWRGGPDRVSA